MFLFKIENINQTQINQRKIIHIDMDAFYASVEQRDHPEYQNRPVIVGGKPGSRSVVAACSYEARKFGVHSAMSSSQAYKLCPDAIFVAPRFEVYKKISSVIQHIFFKYTDLVEPVSLDEAYLDVTSSEYFLGSATRIAGAICQEIKERLKLTASAGVSYNKFLAKLASDVNKPDGIFVILPHQAEKWLQTLPIRKFFGIGKATEKKMNQLGIHNGQDLHNCEKEFLQVHFGKSGLFYYNIIRGIDERTVKVNCKRKSISCETTFPNDVNDIECIKKEFIQLSQKIMDNLHEKSLVAKTLNVKIKYANFQLITRSFTNDIAFERQEQILQVIYFLLNEIKFEKKIRLVGLGVSNLKESNLSKQMTIYDFI